MDCTCGSVLHSGILSLTHIRIICLCNSESYHAFLFMSCIPLRLPVWSHFLCKPLDLSFDGAWRMFTAVIRTEIAFDCLKTCWVACVKCDCWPSLFPSDREKVWMSVTMHCQDLKATQSISLSPLIPLFSVQTLVLPSFSSLCNHLASVSRCVYSACNHFTHCHCSLLPDLF